MILNKIRTLKTHPLPPDSAGSASAFSRFGYDLEAALADIIDNSIDSTARNVEIILHRTSEGVTAVSIADNGKGMKQAALLEAMRFAGRNEHEDTDLGIYGLGLKTASLSQCRSLTVISRKEGEVAACRWTTEGIGKDWSCESLNPVDAEPVFAAAFSKPATAKKSGTVVLWQRLTRLAVDGDPEEFLSELLSRLELRLGLVFHRVLAAGKLSISLTAREIGSSLCFPRRVRARDPIGYTKTGRAGYPKSFTAVIPNVGALELKAHIWPAGSADPNFRLGRRTGTPNQGFYIYRNDRLIQAGGWLGVVKDESDAELSLARVVIDLPASSARDVSVQKSGLQMTAALATTLRAAKAGRQTLSDFLEDARKTYRADRRKARPSIGVPLVPGAGVGVATRRSARAKITKDKLVREISFEWASLPKATIFAIDAEADRILLNRKHRQRILGANRATGVDAPIVKLLLFLLLEHEFDRERVSVQHLAWLKRCNAILYEALKSL
jgi:hypothetical protein